jgi:hypothetical protein
MACYGNPLNNVRLKLTGYILGLMQFLQSGNRLDKPEHCDDDLYEEMMKCWQMNRSDRPKFPELLKFYNNHYKGLMKGVSS